MSAKVLSWLLERDDENPGVRYFALRDLLELPVDDAQVRRARRSLMRAGPVPKILSAQGPDGGWGARDGYQATVWNVVLLAELGADEGDRRVRAACHASLREVIAPGGGFSYQSPPIPSKVVHCHNGLLLHALVTLGFHDDRRVQAALDWQARATTGKLVNTGYYRSGTSGPGFACAVNLHQPCAWGAVKALRAFSAVPTALRNPLTRRAIKQGTQFLLGYDLTKADFPFNGSVSGSWFKFGFPLSYWSDLLELTETLVELGHAGHPRVRAALDYISSKCDSDGLWKMEHPIKGKMLVEIERQGAPSKWVTLRALRVLKRASAGEKGRIASTKGRERLGRKA